MIITEITDKDVRFLALRGSGRKVTGAGVRPLVDGGLPPGLGEELSRLGGGPETVLVLSRRQVLLKYFTLPAQTKEEVRRMVDLQMGSAIPYPLDEAVYDITFFPSEQEGYSRVVAAVIRRDTLEALLDRLHQAGLRPLCAAVSSFGLAAWAAQRAETGGLVLTVSGDASGVEWCFSRGGEMVWSRAFVPQSGEVHQDDVRRNSAVTDAAFREANPGMDVRKVLISAPAACLDLWTPVLAEIFPVPTESVASREFFPAGAGEDLQNTAWAALTGISLSPRGPDLIPASLAEARRADRHRWAWLRLGLAAGCCVAAAGLIFWGELAQQQKRVDVLRQQAADLEPAAKRARARLALQDLRQDTRSRQIWAAEVMRALDRVLPAGTVLTSLQITGNRLTLQGQAAENGDVNVLQQGMVAAPFFSEVTLQYANRRRRFDTEYTDFRLSARLNGLDHKEAP